MLAYYVPFAGAMTRLALAAILALSVPGVAGCSASDSDPAVETEGDEQALTEAKVLAKGVTYPSGLVIAGDHLYFGSNKFIASGDPELDQEFAYWEGKYSRVALTGGRPETVAEIGPIGRARLSGTKLYYSMSGGCWIGRVDIAGAPSAGDKTIYRYDGCDPEFGQMIIAFDITPANKLVVALGDGEIVSGNLDGSGMKKLAEIRIGDSGNITAQAVLADGALYVVTVGSIRDPNSNRYLPEALYRVDLESGATSKVYEFTTHPTNFMSDGTNLFWTDSECKKVSLFAPGARQAKTIAEGFGEVTDIASDGKSVFVADSKRDAIYIVKDAFSAEPKRQRKLAVVKGLSRMIVSGDALYFGTHAVENRKAAGIIGQLKLPQ